MTKLAKSQERNHQLLKVTEAGTKDEAVKKDTSTAMEVECLQCAPDISYVRVSNECKLPIAKYIAGSES